MKAQRVEKLELERESLERDYRSALLEALRDCADGRWGLFGQNAGTLPPRLEERFMPASVARLSALGDQVSAARHALGYVDPMPEMARLDALRGTARSNDLGEARLARGLLDELQHSSAAGRPSPAESSRT